MTTRSEGLTLVLGGSGKTVASSAAESRRVVVLDFLLSANPRHVGHALAELLESGEVKVVIDKVYPLSEAANAVAHMLEHHAKGKVVIAVRPTARSR